MTGSRAGQRWRLLAEFVVIVLGVLVALGVDNWAEEQSGGRRVGGVNAMTPE